MNQPETGEVIIVDDGSTDDSWLVAKTLSQNYQQVHIFQHEGGINRGIAATRNLAIRQCQCPIIGFLDSDDVYLPHAFTAALKILADPEVDGVYGIVSVAYWENGCLSLAEPPEYIGIRQRVAPADLFEVLVNGRLKSFHANSLLVKRTLFEKTGLFDESLVLKEDVEMWIRMAAMGNLVPGDLVNPVAIHTYHKTRSMNRMADVLPRMNKKYRLGLLTWITRKFPHDHDKIRLMEIRVGAEFLQNNHLFFLLRPGFALAILLYLAALHPRIVFNWEVWKLAIKYVFPSL
ncbi:MAG: glycosyltransferase [Anaerolineae bacterium]|nr:glycosyltransferase [Anaerolineae bacterium]